MNVPNLSPDAIEAAFVNTFIARDKRERWLSGLLSPRHRVKLLHRLPHTFDADLDPRFRFDFGALSPHIRDAYEDVLRAWTKQNPQQLCHVMSYVAKMDRKIVSWAKIETNYLLTFGALIIALPERLAIYCPERSNIEHQSLRLLFREAK